MLSIFPNTIPGLSRNSVFGQIARDMDRLFESVATRPMVDSASRTWPGMNVWRDGDDIVAEAEIPGFRMEDIEVLATEHMLTIRGQRRSSTPENATALRIERSVSRFERSLHLPVEIDPDRVRATLADGVLRVTLPVAEAARPRRVQIQSLASTPAREALPTSPVSQAEATA